MWHLVKKDILLCRIGIFFIILINFFLGFINLALTSEYSTIMLGYNLFMGLFLTLLTVLGREEKVNSDMILNSIPLDKKIIVTSRYVSSLLFPLAHGLILFVYSHILKNTRLLWILGYRIHGQIYAISIYSLLIVLSIIITFLSFYLPFYYLKFGKGKALNVIAYFLLVILPALIIRFYSILMDLEFVKYIYLLDKRILTLIAFAISLVLYVASMEVSKRIYSQKK